MTTSSLHNTAYLQAFGATHVLDRKLSPEQLVSELKNIKGLPEIQYSFDAFGDENTSFVVATAALSPGGRVVTVSPVIGAAAGDLPDGKVKSTFMALKGIPASRAYYVELFAGITKLLEDGSIKVRGFSGTL